MVGNLHALALIGLPIVTLAACVKYRGRGQPSERALLEALMACVLVLVMGGLTFHSCRAGQPLMQCLIPGACVVIAVAGVRVPKARYALAAFIFVMMLALCSHYSDIVHGPAYVGEISFWKYRAARLAMERSKAAAACEKLGENDHAAYAAGWLPEATFVAKHREDFEGVALEWERIEVSSLWHSFLTRLYRRTTRPVELWFPGGKLRDAAARLEWRERPAN